MKKFEFNFTNEWKSVYGFDFIKIGWFADTDGTDSYDCFDISITLLGFNFSFTWNSDEAIEEQEMWDNFINKLNTEEFVLSVEETKTKKAKKTTKKIAKKIAKKTKSK